MNEREKAEQLSRSLDAMLRGEETVPKDLEEEIRALSALGRSLADVEFESGPIHRAAVERLIEKYRSKIQEVVMTPEKANKPSPPKASGRTRSRWLIPLALSGALAFLFVCVVVAVVGGSLAWRALRGAEPAVLQTPAAVAESGDRETPPVRPTDEKPDSSLAGTPTAPARETPAAPARETPAAPARETSAAPKHQVFIPSVLHPLPPQRAKLGDVQGVVHVQEDDGLWTVASAGQLLEAGHRVRTAALSSAQIAFYDGSVAHLEPDTEVSVELLDEQDGARIIQMRQWSGETKHDVAPAWSESSRYEVHTPSGIGSAQGTFFVVSVTRARLAHFRVDEGVVEVTNAGVTVVVFAGQLTTVAPQGPPSEPVFQIRGEGEVEQTGAVWLIAGQEFATHDHTIIVGNPLPGDWVRVIGHVADDGTRLADWIVLLHRAPTNRFTITGQVEATGTMTWTVAGLSIGVGPETDIEDGIEIDDLVRVDGIVREDGTLFAESIRLVAERGLSFAFVGVVQSIAETQWTISGISVTVDADTVIDDGLAVGDAVRVRGELLEDGTRLARAIVRLLDREQSFEFVGYVEQMDPWIVSGIAFETEAWTEIDDDIEVRDLVKVEGRILPDGTWVADEIELADDDMELSFEFAGIVRGIDPWIVAGIELAVDSNTEIKGQIGVGDLVKVEGRILPDGTWLATEIKPVEVRPGKGCVQLAAIVLRVDGGVVVLEGGRRIPLGPETLIEGEILSNSVILIVFCVGPDGEMTIVSIIVIYQTKPVIIIIPTSALPSPLPPPPPPPSGKVTICHKPGTKAEKTMVISTDALSGHLGHGDSPGACK